MIDYRMIEHVQSKTHTATEEIVDLYCPLLFNGFCYSTSCSLTLAVFHVTVGRAEHSFVKIRNEIYSKFSPNNKIKAETERQREKLKKKKRKKKQNHKKIIGSENKKEVESCK
jgi:hypothetical protein